MSDSGIAEIVSVFSPRDQIDAKRDEYTGERTRALGDVIVGKSPEESLKSVVDYLYESSSKPHILTCAAQGEAAAKFTVDTIGALEFEDKLARELASEVVDVMSFEEELDRFIGDLLVVDSLTYDEAYSNIDLEDKANLQQFYRNPTRGIYPKVTGDLKQMRTQGGKLGTELRSRVISLGIDEQGSNGNKFKKFTSMTEDSLVKAFDGAIEANESGNITRLDENMKKIVDHFATGDFLVWEESTQNWKEKLDG